MVNFNDICFGLPTKLAEPVCRVLQDCLHLVGTCVIYELTMNLGGLAPILFQRLEQQSYYWRPIVSSLFVTEGVVTPAKQDTSGTVRARRCIAASHEILSCNTVNTSILLSAPCITQIF